MSYEAEQVAGGIVDLVLKMFKGDKSLEDYEKAKDDLTQLLDECVDETARASANIAIRDNSWRWDKNSIEE